MAARPRRDDAPLKSALKVTNASPPAEDCQLLHSVFEALERTGPFLRGELIDRGQPLALFHPHGDGLAPAHRGAHRDDADAFPANAESRVEFTADASSWLDRDLANVEDYLASEITVICQGLEEDKSK
jgi:hypothetical protein